MTCGNRGIGSGILLFILPCVCPIFFLSKGWSGDAMVLGKLPVPGRPTIWIIVGHRLTGLAFLLLQ